MTAMNTISYVLIYTPDIPQGTATSSVVTIWGFVTHLSIERTQSQVNFSQPVSPALAMSTILKAITEKPSVARGRMI